MLVLPLNYIHAWLIRGVFAVCILLLALYSFKTDLKKSVHRILVLTAVFIGSIGVFLITLISHPSEYAYLHYPFGQCVIIIWAMTAFRLNSLDMIAIYAFIFITYIVTTTTIQGLHLYPFGSPEKSAFAGGIFFLATTIFLCHYGTWRFSNYINRLKDKREVIKTEKRKLAKAIHKAEESERLKSAFLANMSHEIRTPMHAVLGFSQLLKRPDLSEDKRQKFIELIETKGNQLLSLIDNILDLSRIDAQMIELEAKHFSVTDITNTIKEQMLNSILTRHSKDFLNIHFNITENSPLIHSDFNRLSLVLFHLIDNAVKFTHKGDITFTYKYESNKHTFSIKDTGCGIKAEKQKFIFERFTQTSDELNRTHSGTGLGLSIVSGLLQLMKGTIQIDSQFGEGSTFTIQIPDIKK